MIGIVRWFTKKYETLERMLFWGWKMRDNHDWDYGYLEIMILIKLKRMKKGVYEKGHHIWDKKDRDYRALLEVIHILENHDNIKSQFHIPEKKPLKGIFAEFLDLKSGDLYDFGSFSKTEKLKEERLDRAYDLIKKWRRFWWD